MNWPVVTLLLLSGGLVSTLVTLTAYLQSQLSPSLIDAVPESHCQASPQFKVAYQGVPHANVPQGNGFDFLSVSWVEAVVCTSGTLSVTAHGNTVAGSSPVLHVVLNGHQLAAESFTKQRTVDIHIPQPGRLILAYLNDFYLADVRVALLKDVEFKGDHCSSFQISVSEATGGQWYPEARLATLVTQVPIVLEPCGQGILSLKLTGRKGKGAFPNIRFSQNGHIKKEIETSEQVIDVHIPLENSPLNVTLTNPYGKTLEDRNLYVSNLSWHQNK